MSSDKEPKRFKAKEKGNYEPQRSANTKTWQNALQINQ